MENINLISRINAEDTTHSPLTENELIQDLSTASYLNYLFECIITHLYYVHVPQLPLSFCHK